MTATVQSLAAPSHDDLDELVALIGSLGYSIDRTQLSSRLERLTPAMGHETWVARDEGGKIVAVAGAHVMWEYNADEPTAQLLLLVVRLDQRRSGVGSALLQRFEEWSRSHHARSLNAVSAAATETAHRFYQKRGYHEMGVRYSKIV